VSDQPAFNAWVQFIGHVRDPLLLPGRPTEVYQNSVYSMASKAAALEFMGQELNTIYMRQGMEILRPELTVKPLLAEYILSPEFKLFVPLWNIRYVEPKIRPMTELPRVEEPGIPLTGQGLETKEHKPS
jgi:hypothetical protein